MASIHRDFWSFVGTLRVSFWNHKSPQKNSQSFCLDTLQQFLADTFPNFETLRVFFGTLRVWVLNSESFGFELISLCFGAQISWIVLDIVIVLGHGPGEQTC